MLMTDKGFEMNASPEQCRRTIDAQLARLQTDYIDVWVYRGKVGVAFVKHLSQLHCNGLLTSGNKCPDKSWVLT